MTPADLDKKRWKKSVENTAKKITKVEDIDIELQVRHISRPGFVGMSIGATMKPKEPADAKKDKKTNS